jgi:hypothetical protein
MGFFLAGIHALFSLSPLTPAYYARYFDLGDRLNLEGELAMSAGVLVLFCELDHHQPQGQIAVVPANDFADKIRTGNEHDGGQRRGLVEDEDGKCRQATSPAR